METMTLEKLREMLDVSGCDPEKLIPISVGALERCAAAIDSAIRERDHLRGNNRWLTDLLDDRESELAALRKRIEAAPITTASSYFGTWCKIKEEGLPEEWDGKRVRLLVEDDDV